MSPRGVPRPASTSRSQLGLDLVHEVRVELKDRVLHLVLAVGADEDGDAGGCDERATDGVLIREFVSPGAVERALGVEPGPGGDLLEHAGLGVVRLGWRISWSRHERPDDCLHRLEIVAVVRSPQLIARAR
jgi:hypothetical protein